MNYFYTLDICPYFIPMEGGMIRKDKKKVLDYDC